MRYTVEAVGLRKRYGDRWVLQGIDLCAEPGSVLGLLGPNGAGKTTMVRILSTLVGFDGGQVEVAGFDLVRDAREVRRRISLVGQHAALDEMLTGSENLEMLARLKGLDRREARARRVELLSQFDLSDAGARYVSTFSGGMRRRLDLAAGLITRPEVIFLDEPTTGLDPRSRAEMWRVIDELAKSGVTVILTTQYLEEADRLADRIVLIDGGKVIAEGTPDSLKTRVGDCRLVMEAVDDAAFDLIRSELNERASDLDPHRRYLAATTVGGATGIRALLDEIDPDRTRLRDFSVEHPTLDDVFLALTREHAHV